MDYSFGCIVGTDNRNGIFFVSNFAVILNKFWFRAAVDELSVDVLVRDAFHRDYWLAILPMGYTFARILGIEKRSVTNIVYNFVVMLDNFWFCTARDRLRVVELVRDIFLGLQEKRRVSRSICFRDALRCGYWFDNMRMGYSCGRVMGMEYCNVISLVLTSLSCHRSSRSALP